MFRRLAAVTGDATVGCHTYAMASSSALAMRYRILATLLLGTDSTGAATLLRFPLATPELAKRFRGLITNFVVFGDPNGQDGGVGGESFSQTSRLRGRAWR